MRIVHGAGAAPPGAVFVALVINEERLPAAFVVGLWQLEDRRIGQNLRVSGAFAQPRVIGGKTDGGILHFVRGDQGHQRVVLGAVDQGGTLFGGESVIDEHTVQIQVQIALFPALIVFVVPMDRGTEQNVFAQQPGFVGIGFQHAPQDGPHRTVGISGIGAECHVLIPRAFGIAVQRCVGKSGNHRNSRQYDRQEDQK